jgi:hypothetical protein
MVNVFPCQLDASDGSTEAAGRAELPDWDAAGEAAGDAEGEPAGAAAGDAAGFSVFALGALVGVAGALGEHAAMSAAAMVPSKDSVRTRGRRDWIN